MSFWLWLRGFLDGLDTDTGAQVRQKNSGDATVQVGEMPDGNVHVLHVGTVNVYGQHPANTRAARGVVAQPTVSDVLHVLDQLDAYRKRIPVLDFAAKEFGTRLVKDLDERALKRVYEYARTTLMNCEDHEVRARRS
jgi:hypothetical protein